jgi:hypothetical protein
MIGLELGDIMIQDDFTAINKGNIVELSAGLAVEIYYDAHCKIRVKIKYHL